MPLFSFLQSLSSLYSQHRVSQEVLWFQCMCVFSSAVASWTLWFVQSAGFLLEFFLDFQYTTIVDVWCHFQCTTMIDLAPEALWSPDEALIESLPRKPLTEWGRVHHTCHRLHHRLWDGPGQLLRCHTSPRPHQRLHNPHSRTGKE